MMRAAAGLACLLALLLAPSAAQALTLDDGLVARFRFDAGSTQDDVGPPYESLTLSGDAAFVADRAGFSSSALGFPDGVDDVARAGAPVIPAGAKTIAFWLRSTGKPPGTEYQLVGSAGGTPENGTRLDLDYATLRPVFVVFKAVQGTPNFTVTGTTAITQNQWQHLAFTWDGTTSANGVRIYLNGADNGQGTATTTETVAGSLNLWIGALEANRGHVGQIDEVCIWSRALGAAEVARLYARGFSAGALVGHWRFDEASGTTAADSAGDHPAAVSTGASQPGWSTARPPSLASGGSLDLDGVDDIVRVVSVAGALGPFDFRSTDDLSVAFWAFTDDNAEPSSGGFNHRAWHIQNGAGQTIQLIVRESGKTIFSFGASGIAGEPATVFPVGAWSHVVTVKSGSTLRIYQNGVEVTGTAMAGGDPQAGGTSFTIGGVRHQSGSPTGPFDGKIDDFRVYSRALTAVEVGALYTARAPAATPVTAGLKLWLDAADETTFRLSGSSVSEWRDKSPAGVHVTQGSAGAQPLLVPSALNGLPAVRFDGGDALVSASTAALSFTEATIFLVRNAANGPLGTPFAISIPGTMNNEFLFFAGLHGSDDWNPVFHHTSSGIYTVLDHPTRPAGHFVQAGVWGTTPADLQNFVNGVASAQAIAGSASDYSVVDRAAYLGVRGPGDTFYTGDLAEVLVYDRKLSASELTEVGVYLEKKYALPTAYDGGGVSRWSETVYGLGPVGWWRLDETSGSTAFDAAQPAQNGTHAGTVTLGAEPAFDAATLNRAYALSGDDYVDMGDVLDAGMGSLTFLAWFRMSSAPTTSDWKILNKGLTTAGDPPEAGFAIRVLPAQFGVQVTGANQPSPVNAFVGLPSLGQWHFVAGVLDRAAGELRLYLDPANGAATTSVNASSVGSLDTNMPLTIGALGRGTPATTSEHFVGSIDEVVIFQKALTGAEVQRLHDAALTAAVPGRFFGEDFNTDPGGGATARLTSRPNADAARASFLAAAGQLAIGVETFEGFAVPENGAVNVSSFDVAFGALPVTATVARVPAAAADGTFRLRDITGSGMEGGTYPVSGAQYLITNGTEHEVRFSAGVNALGFYATDVETASLSLELYSGGSLVTSTAVRAPPPNATDGSALFFGVVSDATFDRAVFRGATPSDGFGFDDFTVGLAGVRIFAGGSGTHWRTSANWNPLGAPSGGDRVYIAAGAGPVAITASASVRSLTLNAGPASVVSVQAPLAIAEGLVITSGTLEVVPPGSLAVTGSVTVDGGTLKGSIVGSGGPVTLSAGGTLKGNVAVGRAVIVGAGGRIAPGE